MNLVSDIGNTQTKTAVFSGGDIVFVKAVSSPSESFFYELIRKFPVKKAIISSVSVNSDLIASTFREKLIQVVIPDQHTPLPIRNLYLTKETLGFDRLATAVGAHTAWPDCHVLIVDAGTAITLDIVNNKGEFLGGNISPGLEMRIKALHTFTKKLPLILKDGETGLTARTTEEAIRYGVYNGIIYEIDGYIDSYKNNYPDLKIILTGGDAKYFDKKLKNSIFVDSNLNLRGLNQILEYNAT